MGSSARMGANDVLASFKSTSLIELSGPSSFKNAFSLLGELVIPGLRHGDYSSVILDGDGGVLPGQVLRAWVNCAAENRRREKIPVLVMRASRHLSIQQVRESFTCMPRIGSRPLIFTDWLGTGDSVRKMVGELHSDGGCEQITVASIASAAESVTALNEEFAGKVTVLRIPAVIRVRELFASRRFASYCPPREPRATDKDRESALGWHKINRAMRAMGREIWQEFYVPHGGATGPSGSTAARKRPRHLGWRAK